ncbi:MAG TPA: hypothetical protein VFA85_05575 [Terriglobales bacterium]|nr:hypothetical protein [Terriglobales bacterium]
MSDDSSSLGSAFVKGVGAVVAALVLFVAEQYIQHRYWTDNQPQSVDNGSHQNQSPPPVPAIIPIDGRVVDTLGTKVIDNALIDLNINGMHEQQNTDSEGRYAFSLRGFDPSTAASMTIKAQGYKDATVNLLLSAMQEDKELKLEALVAPPVLGHSIGAIVGSQAAGHAATPVQLAKPLTGLKYVRRVDAKMMVAQK